MTWKLFAATFWLIFLAELGDKTQLAVMLQSAIHGRAGVFWAASLALVLSTLLAVFLGGLIAKVVSERVIHAVGGVLFLGVRPGHGLFGHPARSGHPAHSPGRGKTRRRLMRLVQNSVCPSRIQNPGFRIQNEQPPDRPSAGAWPHSYG